MRKRMIAATAFALAATMAFSSAAGSWVDVNQDGSSWMYRQDDGSFLKENWLQDGETWYYLDAEGKMLTGWAKINGKYEMFNDSGAWQYSVINLVDSVIGPGGGIAEEETEAESTEEAAEEPAAEPEKTEEDLQAEAVAGSVLSAITNENMTKPEKAKAIYNWMHANMTYSNNGMYPDAYTEGYAALYGFRARRGNCYVYYSMSKYLLGLCGMPSERVVRASDGGHFWNLVNVDGVYYHFDACPRRIRGRWCLVTTAYLQQTSWGAHNFDIAAHPATP